MARRESIITLTQGDDKVLNLGVQDPENYPVDLSGADASDGSSGIYARFKKADGTLLVKTLSDGVALVSGPKGLVTVSLTDAETKLLKVGEGQSFELQYDVAGKSTYVDFDQKLTVRAPLA